MTAIAYTTDEQRLQDRIIKRLQKQAASS